MTQVFIPVNMRLAHIQENDLLVVNHVSAIIQIALNDIVTTQGASLNSNKPFCKIYSN